MRGGAGRGPKNNVWTVLVLEDQAVDNAVIEGDIVNNTELEPAASGLQRYTLLRIRGWLSVSRDPVLTTDVTLFMAIYLTDLNAGTVDASNATKYTEEDVIWTAGVNFAGAGAGAVEVAPPARFDVDVKAMRRFTSGSDVRITFIGNQAASGLLVSGVMRALVRKGGN